MGKEKQQKHQNKVAQQQQQHSAAEEATAKKQCRLGLDVTKAENYSEWYSQLIVKAELIEYYDVSGCYVIRPWAYSVWEHIQSFFDSEIKKLGVKNCYFPMFVSEAALEREKTHVADFAPEVAWVTKAGNTDLANPIAIRPTSETVMYPSFAKWCKSHRDLPLKLNQWCNVVRWEFKHPTPFLRTREFLWQEGHTAYATKEEAETEVFDILNLYARVYTDLLAIPVVKGRKSEKEKFAGADFTTSVEAYVPVNGRGIQGATSHHLGQNFSKMFDIAYASETKGQAEFVYQNSWGLSTRSIGAMVMIHGDDTGLVLPPRVADIQVIVIPVGITVKMTEADRNELENKVEEIVKTLKEAHGVRAVADARNNVSPGWKFNHWEIKGVPIRLELGPKDLAKQQALAVIRHSGQKVPMPLSDLGNDIKRTLDTIHDEMYKKVEQIRDENMVVCLDWDDLAPQLAKKRIVLSPFCGLPKCETAIKDATVREEEADVGVSLMGAKTLCIPLEQPKDVQLPEKCINPNCSDTAQFFALFGRSY
ncbi:hypothetical protein GPALN_004144 [Globodera pallida]|nr:hypothetical protein GPALN_004144 [Globodera pallida]